MEVHTRFLLPRNSRNNCLIDGPDGSPLKMAKNIELSKYAESNLIFSVNLLQKRLEIGFVDFFIATVQLVEGCFVITFQIRHNVIADNLGMSDPIVQRCADDLYLLAEQRASFFYLRRFELNAPMLAIIRYQFSPEAFFVRIVFVRGPVKQLNQFPV